MPGGFVGYPVLRRILILALAIFNLARAELPDISTVKPDLVVPALSGNKPGAGRRVKGALPSYEKKLKTSAKPELAELVDRAELSELPELAESKES